ncbi:MAG TPA: hypothetical protein VFU01_11110 [Gemmatimonadaceae bacterium]|nr:hypothetical protein [Gemmatimonadaceae bacterium]
MLGTKYTCTFLGPQMTQKDAETANVKSVGATAKPKEPGYPVSHRDLTRQVLTKRLAVAVHPAVSLFAIRLIRDELLTFLRFSAAPAAPGFAIPITETVH